MCIHEDSFVEQGKKNAEAAITKQNAAVKTLEQKKYTYFTGAQLWKPPIGKAPDFIKNDTAYKDSKLITDLKYDMARFLNLSPEDYNLSFEDYFTIARSNVANRVVYCDFCERYASNMASIASIIPPAVPSPNIIFGVLTNGEIFVEVNGAQHTPDETFYKMAAIQSSTLAHEVRDLELTLKERTAQLEATAKQLNKMEQLTTDLAESLQNWRPM